MTKLKGRAIALPVSENNSIVLFEEDGKIRIALPEMEKILGQPKRKASLSFVPEDFDFLLKGKGKSETSVYVHEFTFKRYKEILQVELGLLHPIITYVHADKHEKVGMVPGKLKGMDFGREVTFFNELLNQVPRYDGEFYARTMRSFYSAASVKSFEGEVCFVENSNHIRFILLKSHIPGYNLVLSKRVTNLKEYVQIVGVNPTPEEKVLIDKGERPFLEPHPELFSLDAGTEGYSSAIQFVIDWVKRSNYLVSVL